LGGRYIGTWVRDIMMTMTRRAIVCPMLQDRQTDRRTDGRPTGAVNSALFQAVSSDSGRSNSTAHWSVPAGRPRSAEWVASPTRPPLQYGAADTGAPPNIGALSAQANKFRGTFKCSPQTRRDLSAISDRQEATSACLRTYLLLINDLLYEKRLLVCSLNSSCRESNYS